MAKGKVYILVNTSHPDKIKIGRTSLAIDKRIKQLNTGSIGDFSCWYAREVDDAAAIEQKMQTIFSHNRITREFYKVPPENATMVLRLFPGKDAIFNNLVPGEFDKAGSSKAPIATFDLLKIPVGSELVFTRNDQIKCCVASNRKVSYHGKEYSLSKLTLKLFQQMGYKWTSINGFNFWTYKQMPLKDIYLKKVSNE